MSDNSAQGDAGHVKEALLILVHGSPQPAAYADMFRVVESIRERQEFDLVEVGFLECNEPAIPAAIDACVARGARRVVAVPYFLHTGTHVADDLPTFFEEAHARHQGVEFRMGDYIGRSESLTDLLEIRTRAVLAAGDS